MKTNSLYRNHCHFSLPDVGFVARSVLAVAMHFTTHHIYYNGRRNLYPLLYMLVGLAVVSTYYYCFADDQPLFKAWQKEQRKINSNT